LLVILFAPVLYVLSIGPVALLAKWNPAIDSIGVIYGPLGFVATCFEPLEKALTWYIELWTG
jgi:hypothetical protein